MTKYEVADGTYLGVPVEELPREELYEIIAHYATRLESMMDEISKLNWIRFGGPKP